MAKKGGPISAFIYTTYGCSSLLLLISNSLSYHYREASRWRKNILAAITQGRVIDDNLKSQKKIATSYTNPSFSIY